MTKGRKTLWLALGATALAGAAVVFGWTPSEDPRLDAIVAGAEQAVGDLHAEYKVALNGQPAYHGYVIEGDFDSRAVISRMRDLGVPLLSLDEVRASDWRKETGRHGWGPTYIYLRKDTGQQTAVIRVELLRCARFTADVKISIRDGGGVTYCLGRRPGQPWQVVGKKDAYQVVY